MSGFRENVIELEDSYFDAVVKMAKGNPGAATVLVEILKKEHGTITILHLDDLQIRGWKIWYAFKDYCHQDLDKFISCVNEKNKDMVEFINEYGK